MRNIEPVNLVAILIFLTLATINVLLIKVLSDCI